VPGTTPNTGLTYPLLADAADIEAAVKTPLLQIDAMRLGRRALSMSAQQVLEVGQTGQIRAGRQLAAADFTNMGLAAPLGLWNLSDLTDASGNARALTNKGTVPFGVGINGSAATAAQFAGSTGQALWIANATWQQIRTGSWGCWFRTAKRGTQQELIDKWGVASQSAFLVEVSAANVVSASISTTGADALTVAGMSDVADDRWHFAVVTSDGTRLRVYVDGALELPGAGGAIFAGTSPLDFGSRPADATNTAAGSLSHYGRIDEAFITGDVLSDEQVRNLYCASITHGLTDIAAAALTPRTVMLKVRRRRRGGNLVTGDFPSTPSRLYTFTAGAVTNGGSDANGTAGTSATLLPNTGTGAIVDVADADGSAGGAKSLSGAHTGLTGTDAGLPATTTSRSFGIWFKTSTAATVMGLVAWGTSGTAQAQLNISGSSTLSLVSGADAAIGPVVTDGLWHFAVGVEDNAAADGVKRKLYLDGRVVAGSTVLNSITLTGANAFKVGINPGAVNPFVGQLDDAFVFSGALTAEQVRTLYNKGSQALAASPKSEGDHVEAMEATRLLATFDSLEGVDQVDLEVMA
jgi:hypothetical protein